MATFMLKRLISMAIVMWLAITAVFLTFHVLPGNPALLRLGMHPSPAALHALEQKMGLNKPLYIQYMTWFWKALHGNFGRSSLTGLPALPLVLAKTAVTLELAVAAMILALVIAIPVGIVAAVKADSTTDQIIRFFSLSGFSLPSYWLALLFMLLLAYHFRVFPAGGYVSFGKNPLLNLWYLALPSITLGLIEAAPLIRFLRASMLESLPQDYVRTARSKGLPERVVIYRHAFRNALIPMITVLGINTGGLIGGLVVTEQVFAWPGIGWELVQAITNRDYSVVETAVTISAFTFVLMNFLVDTAYAMLDPRITYDSAK